MATCKNFLDTQKIPYLLFKMKYKKNGKKDPSDGVIPNFQNISYDDAMKWNKLRSKWKDKPDTMNVILKHSRIMVIDIDDSKNCNTLLNKYGDTNKTVSTTKKLPHLWRKMHPQDNNDTRVAVGKVDLVYQNIFESIEAKFENIKDDMEVFNEWTVKSASTISKDKKAKIPKHQSVNNLVKPISAHDEVKYRELVNIIPTSKLDYDEWMRCVFSLHNINGNLRSVALEWSKTSPKYDEDPDEFDIAWNYCKEGDLMCNEGTLKTMAAKYDKPKFMEWFIANTQEDVNPDDLAKTFIQELGEHNLAYTQEKILYIFKNNNWHRDDDLSILKYSIRIQAQSVIETLREQIIQKCLTADPKQSSILMKIAQGYSKDLEKLKKKKIMDDASAFVIQYLSNKSTTLEYEPIVFDVNEEQLFNLHFKNGVYDLLEKEFRQREHSDYITKYLAWDYNEDVTSVVLKEVEDDFKDLQPDPEQFKLMISFMAYCLCGDTSRNTVKFNIGTKAGNGKSTVPELHQIVFPIYSKVLDQEFFKKGYTKRHKTSIQLLRSPIRMTYIEEIDEKQLDVGFIKTFLAGNLSVEELFATTVDGKIQSKVQVLGNEPPVMDSDNGILRRGFQQNFEASFLPKEKYDKAIKKGEPRVHLEDIHYKSKYQNNEYKNAYLQLLLKHFDIHFHIPSKNRDAFKKTLSENDDNKDKILDKLRTNPKGGICKEDMVAEFHPTPFRVILKIIRAEYGNIYNCNERRVVEGKGSKKGWFTGISFVKEE